MTLKEHKKHTALKRPGSGNFGRNEWAITGAPCDVIKQLARQIIDALANEAKIAYADALHNDDASHASAQLNAGACMEFMQTPAGAQVAYTGDLDSFTRHNLFKSCDMVLVNGNHHQAKKQVVIIDAAKKGSLQKRVTELTDVHLFLLADGEREIFDFIKAAVPDWQQIPVYSLSETGKIIDFFRDVVISSKPEINALVLAGGKSERMGQDKGAINLHGKPQRYHVADLLKNITNNVFISCRADQQNNIDPGYQTLTDTFTGLGPFGAILSAFREDPDTAWLVIACDLPLLDAATLEYLIANRDPSAMATAFVNPYDGFPEPLITIWEPKSYPVLLSFLSQGYSCPRKVLINNDCKLLQVFNAAVLTNVNTPQDLEKVKETLTAKNQTT